MLHHVKHTQIQEFRLQNTLLPVGLLPSSLFPSLDINRLGAGVEGVRVVVLLEGSGVRIEAVLLCCLLFWVCWRERTLRKTTAAVRWIKCQIVDTLIPWRRQEGTDGWIIGRWIWGRRWFLFLHPLCFGSRLLFELYTVGCVSLCKWRLMKTDEDRWSS